VTDPMTAKTASGWDRLLMMLTVVLLGALGTQSLLGTLYVWWAYRVDPLWERHAGYAAFIDTMNLIAAPLVVALVVVMGLCVPKRLVARRTLVALSASMLAVGVLGGAATGSLAVGLAVYLALSALIQVAVVVLTVAGAGGLAYLSENRLAKVGSGLLHLGFILFALVIVALQRSPLMLPVFYASAIMLTGGSALSFYARESVRRMQPAGAPAVAEGNTTRPGDDV